MEQPEVPLDQVQEDIEHHTAHHEHHAAAELGWTRWVALSTALIAALAALAALAAGHSETEVMQAKMSANDRWNYMQSASLKKHAVEDTAIILAALDKPVSPTIEAGQAKYTKQEDEQKAFAEGYEQASEQYLQAHERYSYGVTMFQVAIALGAIAALTRRRLYWLCSMGLGLIGLGFACSGIEVQQSIPAPVEEVQPQAAPGAAAGQQG